MAARVDTPENEQLQLQVQVPDELKKYAVLQDRVLYVANDYLTHSIVLDFEMRLMRMGLATRKQGVPMQRIEQMHHGANTMVSKHETTERARAFNLLRQAVNMSASDIHVVIGRHHAEIKMRVDGYLSSYVEIAADEALSLVAALYVSCQASTKNGNQFNFNGPLAARLTASDGLPEKLYAVRFASTPSDTTGLVVLRLLYDEISSRTDQKRTKIDLPNLGFNHDQVVMLQSMADAPNGMVIIVGPTGAGKSTTLKFVMEWIHDHYPHFNILTVEDPPEYPITGASAQIPVNKQEDDVESGDSGRGMQYASIIATTLRLDPDILMVGEIRDGYSAQAGLRAAETGHRLWTTLHANDAWEAINRLVDLLREAGMVDSMSVLANTQNLAGTMAQRLIPKLCPYCKIPLKENLDRLSPHILQELMDAVPDIDVSQIFLRGDGCEKCVPDAQGDVDKQKADKRHGILGRTVVAEIVMPDQTLLDIARAEGVPAARYFWLKHRGGRVLMDHALEKIQEGILSPDVVREFAGPLIGSQQILARMDREKP